jgi:hypothetical protein
VVQGGCPLIVGRGAVAEFKDAGGLRLAPRRSGPFHRLAVLGGMNRFGAAKVGAIRWLGPRVGP